MDDLYNKLSEYSSSDMYPFHMPGHKRTPHPKLPFEIDVTEIEGFDNLHYPKGVLKSFSNILVNGSTGGILAGIRTLTDFGDRVLIARNCHKSVYNAVELFGLRAEFIMPAPAQDGGKELNIYGAVKPSQIAEKLDEYPDIKLVVITSPTYEGICSDVEKISELCRSHDIRLFVDEAHGAHPALRDVGSRRRPGIFFSPSAIDLGADMSVISLHKTMPALTQTAMINTSIKDGGILAKLKENLSVFQTSSPSYVLLASAQHALEVMDSPKAATDYCDLLEGILNKVRRFRYLKILFNSEHINTCHDCGKLLISTSETNLSGYQLAEKLRKSYHIETEMSAPDYVLALSTVCDTKEGFDRLFDALKDIDANIGCADKVVDPYLIKNIPERRFIPFEKYRYKTKRIPLSEAQGHISMETVMAYPPGIPCIVPGEVFSGEILAYIERIKSLGGTILYRSAEEYPSDHINIAEL